MAGLAVLAQGHVSHHCVDGSQINSHALRVHQLAALNVLLADSIANGAYRP